MHALAPTQFLAQSIRFAAVDAELFPT